MKVRIVRDGVLFHVEQLAENDRWTTVTTAHGLESAKLKLVQFLEESVKDKVVFETELKPFLH